MSWSLSRWARCVALAALLFAGPAGAKDATAWGLGVYGGPSRHFGGTAVAGKEVEWTDTYATTSRVRGVELERASVDGGFFGSFVLGVERFEVDYAMDSGGQLGRVTATPVTLWLRGGYMPPRSGFGFFGGFGLGLALHEFEKGGAILDLQRQAGMNFPIKVKDGFFVDLGLGVSAFLVRNVSVEASYRLIVGGADTTGWPLDVDILRYPGSQFLLSAKLWLR